MEEKIILIIFGAIFMLIGAVALIKTMQKRRKCSGVTMGIVKEVKTENGEDKDPNAKRSRKKAYYTTVEYKVGEETYLQKSGLSSTMNIRYVGEKVEVHYNPEEPTTSYWGTNDFLGIFTGIIFAAVGIRISNS